MSVDALWYKTSIALKKVYKDIDLWLSRHGAFIDVHNVPKNIDIDDFANNLLAVCHSNGIEDMKIAESTPLHYMVGKDCHEETAEWFHLISPKYS